MTRIVVTNSISLDGVMQAPGRADEETRGGFTHGGWAPAYNDPVMAETMAQGIVETDAILFGRRTYEDFFAVWPGRTDGNPFTDVLNNTQKYVASRTLQEPLAWRNSTLLKGDAADAIAELRKKPGKNIVVLGSGDLLQTLMRHNLVDEYILLVHPIVLGTGRRLFNDGGTFARLDLIRSTTTTTGVVIASYQPMQSA